MHTLERVACALAVAATLVATAPASADSVRLRPQGAVTIDASGSPLGSPRGVSCGTGTTLVVADTGNSRVLLYTIEDGGTRAARTVVVPQLTRPMAAAIGPDGTLFVLDGKRRAIGRVDGEGTLQGYVEPAAGPDGFVPRSFRVAPDGTLWVLDVHDASVRVLDASGSVSRTIALPDDVGAPADLTLDSRGTVYVVDSVRRQVYAAASDAATFTAIGDSLEGKAEFPAAIAADDGGRLFVADQNGGSILILGTDGSFRGRQSGFGWKDGLLRYPSGLCLDGAGHLFVADRANHRVQVFAILK